LERRAIVDDIAHLYEQIVRHNLPRKWIEQLKAVDMPMLQFQALRALTLFVPGPRIASTPTESVLHPSKMFFKKLVITEGIVPILFQLCESPVIDVMSQSVFHLFLPC